MIAADRHLRFGWWALALFAACGLALEVLHGFKARSYLSVSNETRRLVWTLAHAHGIGLALVNIVFGLAVKADAVRLRGFPAISPLLLAASVLLPAGFFLGGIGFYEGDPGIGIILVPIGALLLLAALVMTARAAGGTE